MSSLTSARRSFVFCVAFTLLSLTAYPATAGIVSIQTGISTTWDRLSQPAGSTPLTLQFSNDNPTDGAFSSSMSGYGVHLRLVPQAGATGTLAISGTSSLTNPTTNALFPSSDFVLATPVEGGFVVSAFESTDTARLVPQTPVNAFSFFLSSSDALGTFNIVVDGIGGSTSYNNINDPDTEYFFGNADGSNLVVGQITVTAVPEPSSIALVGCGGLALAAWQLRRRRAR